MAEVPPAVGRRTSAFNAACLAVGAIGLSISAFAYRDKLAASCGAAQDALTEHGENLLIYLSEVADTVFQKIHQQFAFASPNEVLEGRVRQTLTRKTPPANKQTRPRDEDGNWENDPMHDGVQHRARRTRHSSPEPAESPASVAVASLASSLASRPGAGATIGSESALQFDAAMEEGVPARETSEVGLPANGPERTLAQRFQSDPAGLIGATLKSTWVDETYMCEVDMIRKCGDKYLAGVVYEADGVYQWEKIGLPPYNHTLVSEPKEKWLRNGSEYVDAKVLIKHESNFYLGVVMAWLPPSAGDDTTLYKVYHEGDGDYEDLDHDELMHAIALYKERM